MTLYATGQVTDAYRNAQQGGQSLYLCRKRDGDPQTGWLIDHQIERLMSTARQLGIRKVRVHRPNSIGQFVVLTGHWLERAKQECQQGTLL